jgi:DNA/RNA endonuclease G (NUC1)
MKPSKNIPLLIFASLLWTGSASCADRCDCDSEVRDKIDSYDALLRLSPSKQSSAKSRNTIWGLPTASTSAAHEHLLTQKDYLIWYDDDLRVPLWVSYRLKKSDLKTHRERLECFRMDPRLNPAVAGTCDDYDEPTYDRGHLARTAIWNAPKPPCSTHIYSRT